MFTGIVHGACPVVELEQLPGLARLVVQLPPQLGTDLAIGASVALDGVCMTVTAIDGDRVYFDAMQETLQLTTLGQLQVGDVVNVERSFKQGVEVGGHIISGHVDGTAYIVAVQQFENNRVVHYQLPQSQLRYVFKKGFIAVNGCSLTVVDVDREAGQFSISFIPETLRVTTHAAKQAGDQVNIEVDRQTQAIVDTVERVLRDNPAFLRDLLQQG